MSARRVFPTYEYVNLIPPRVCSTPCPLACSEHSPANPSPANVETSAVNWSTGLESFCRTRSATRCWTCPFFPKRSSRLDLNKRKSQNCLSAVVGRFSSPRYQNWDCEHHTFTLPQLHFRVPLRLSLHLRFCTHPLELELTSFVNQDHFIHWRQNGRTCDVKWRNVNDLFHFCLWFLLEDIIQWTAVSLMDNHWMSSIALTKKKPNYPPVCVLALCVELKQVRIEMKTCFYGIQYCCF